LNKKEFRSQKSRATSKGLLFIVSAPSGAGKTTLCQMVVDYFGDIKHSISYTTRISRYGEKDGVDYHFVDKKRFQEMIENNVFLEWAEVHGNMYGTSIRDLEPLLTKGYDVVLDIDVQGARQAKERMKSGTFIFVLPPSLAVCKERLRKRANNDREEIEKRLENAKMEIKEVRAYDYSIINDDLNSAFEIFKSIIIAERSRKEHSLPKVKEIFGDIIK
jgi:guanylate kinase